MMTTDGCRSKQSKDSTRRGSDRGQTDVSSVLLAVRSRHRLLVRGVSTSTSRILGPSSKFLLQYTIPYRRLLVPAVLLLALIHSFYHH